MEGTGKVKTEFFAIIYSNYVFIYKADAARSFYDRQS
jgi:hypothetical protein